MSVTEDANFSTRTRRTANQIPNPIRGKPASQPELAPKPTSQPNLVAQPTFQPELATQPTFQPNPIRGKPTSQPELAATANFSTRIHRAICGRSKLTKETLILLKKQANHQKKQRDARTFLRGDVPHLSRVVLRPQVRQTLRIVFLACTTSRRASSNEPMQKFAIRHGRVCGTYRALPLPVRSKFHLSHRRCNVKSQHCKVLGNE